MSMANEISICDGFENDKLAIDICYHNPFIYNINT